MQVEAFRKVNGLPYASTMCIGNLRSGMSALSHFLRTGDRETLRHSAQYFEVIALFAIGGGLGTVLSRRFGLQGIWCSCPLLAIAFILMHPHPHHEG